MSNSDITKLHIVTFYVFKIQTFTLNHGIQYNKSYYDMCTGIRKYVKVKKVSNQV